MMSGGIYNYLGAEKQVGDMAITDAKINEYYTATGYCPKYGSFKGTNINLNMPGVIYACKIRPADLEVDVCILPRGDVRVID
jgi:predicted RNA-binding protein associated with RNAse of E/G family